jgi:hypothetical protein
MGTALAAAWELPLELDLELLLEAIVSMAMTCKVGGNNHRESLPWATVDSELPLMVQMVEKYGSVACSHID